MSLITLERIIEDVQTLSSNEQRQLRESLERAARTAELRRIQAKYKGLGATSENFAAAKAEEITLEDRLGKI